MIFCIEKFQQSKPNNNKNQFMNWAQETYANKFCFNFLDLIPKCLVKSGPFELSASCFYRSC